MWWASCPCRGRAPPPLVRVHPPPAALAVSGRQAGSGGKGVGGGGGHWRWHGHVCASIYSGLRAACTRARDPCLQRTHAPAVALAACTAGAGSPCAFIACTSSHRRQLPHRYAASRARSPHRLAPPRLAGPVVATTPLSHALWPGGRHRGRTCARSTPCCPCAVNGAYQPVAQKFDMPIPLMMATRSRTLAPDQSDSLPPLFPTRRTTPLAPPPLPAPPPARSCGQGEGQG
jgi:hypothetical protein